MAQMTSGNGQQPGLGAGGDTAQRLIVNAQYVKDLSFENPRAPMSLQQQQGAPSVDINVDVNAQPMNGGNFEVVLTVKASAKVNNEALFILELVYGAVVTPQNVPQELLAPVLLVETPRLLFPFARAIVAEATHNGGFPPLMINPIDFTELLRRNTGQPDGGPQLVEPSSAG